jgi:hypothetical protein
MADKGIPCDRTSHYDLQKIPLPADELLTPDSIIFFFKRTAFFALTDNSWNQCGDSGISKILNSFYEVRIPTISASAM